MRKHKYCAPIWLLLTLLIFAAPAGACGLDERYSVTVFPEVNQPGFQQDAIIYHFSGQRVTSRWGRTMAYPNGSRAVLAADLTGTFDGGKLVCEQTAEMKIYLPKGMEHPGVPDGLNQIHTLVSSIRGTLTSRGRVEGTVKTETRQIRSHMPDGSQPGRPWIFKAIPVDPATTAETLPLSIELPTTIWYASKQIMACGKPSDRVRRALERIDAHWAAASQSIARTRYSLAKSQIGTLTTDISDLKGAIEAEGGNCSIVFTGLPSDPMMIRLIRLRFMWSKWKESYLVVNEALGEVQKQLYKTKRVLSINVFKSALKNYIGWSNSIPTDVVSGLAQYSFITGLADFPRSGLGMVAEAEKDAGILKDQFKTKEILEDLEPFYDKKRDYVLGQAKRTSDLIRKLEPAALESLDRSLQAFFSGLRWASWRASDERTRTAQLPAGKPE